MTVKNASGCVSSLTSTTINAQPATPATPTISSSAAGAVCQGTSVVLTSSSGATYQWYKSGVAIGGATSQTYTTTLAGSYTVVITGANNCSSIASSPSIVFVNPIPDAAIAQGSILAFSDCSQTTLTLSATTTSPSPTFEWYRDNIVTPVATSQTYNVTQTGSYYVKITSAGCSNTSAVSTVSAAPSATATGSTSVCQGETVTLTTSSLGTYKWQKQVASSWVDIIGAIDASFNATETGTYRVEVTNINNIISTSCPISVTVNPLPTLSITASSATAICAGSQVILSANASGTPTIKYQWKVDGTNLGSETSNTYTATTSGAYSVLITDGNGCQKTSNATNITVSVIPSVPIIGTVTQPTCDVSTASVALSGLPSSGSWTVTANDGTNSSTFTGTGSIGTFSGLAANKTYTFSVTNSSGCTSASSSSVVINAQPTPPSAASASLTQPTCTVSTGAISITSPTGAGLTYSIDGSLYQSSTAFNGVAAGTYSLRVMNSSGCVSTATSVTINAQPLAPSAPAVTPIQPSCSVATGGLTITAPTGTGLTYSIDGSTYTSTTSFSGLTPNVYNITVKSAAGCIGTATSATINAQPATPSQPTVNTTQPSCSVSTGEITIPSPLGSGLTYSIDGQTYQSSATFTGVVPGTYSVTVKNASGCVSSIASATINPPSGLPPLPTSTVTHPTCSVSTGVINVIAPLGSGFTYSIDGLIYQSSPKFNLVNPGIYSLNVKNSAGCLSSSATINIDTQPSAPVAPTINTLQPNCSVSTGSIEITAPTGLGITYSIDGTNYQSATLFSGLSFGTYDVLVKNSAGCVGQPTIATINAQPIIPNPPASINGKTTVARYIVETYTANPVAGVTNYTWTLPNGWTGTSSTNVITVNTGGTGGVISVKANLNACTSTATTITISVNSLPNAVPDNGYYTEGDPTNPPTIAPSVKPLPNVPNVVPYYCNVNGTNCSTTPPALPTQPGMYVYCIKTKDTITGEISSPCQYDTIKILPKPVPNNGYYTEGDPTNPPTIGPSVKPFPNVPGVVPYYCDVNGQNCSTTPPALPTQPGMYVYCIKSIDTATGNVSTPCQYDTIKILPKPIPNNGYYTEGDPTNPPTIAPSVKPLPNVPGVVPYYCNANGTNCSTTPPALPSIPGTYVYCIKVIDTLTGYVTNPCQYDTIRILPAATPVPDINITNIQVPVNGNLSSNDKVPAGTHYGAPISAVDNPADGKITINADGSYTFSASIPGKYIYYVPVCAPNGPIPCPTSPLEITVLDPATATDKPVANNDYTIVANNGSATLNILANDKAGDLGGSLDLSSLSLVDQPSKGKVVLNADGTITYTPQNGYYGMDSVVYKICDKSVPVQCTEAVAYFNVQPPGSAALTIASDDYNHGLGSTDGTGVISGNVLLNDKNTGDGSIAVTPQSISNDKGKLVINADGTYTFTPAPGFSGPVDIVYEVCGGTPATCAKATLHILVDPVPIATPDLNLANSNVPVNGNVGTNDKLPQGSTYGSPMPASSNPSGGSITMNPDGSYTFKGTTPGKYIYNVPVCVPGGVTPCPTIPLLITVLDPSASDKPIANHDVATTKENKSVVVHVLANDRAGDPGRSLVLSSLVISGQPKNGSAKINADGTITYTPKAGFVGTDSIVYTICDNNNPMLCETAVVYCTVEPANTPDKTVAGDDVIRTIAGLNASGSVLANDLHTGGATLSARLVSGPSTAQGTFTLNADGTYNFTPAVGYSGTVAIVYEVCGGTPVHCAKATLYILVEPIMDTDGDGVPDHQELLDGTDLKNPCSYTKTNITLTPGAAWNNGDCDGDGVTNAKEKSDGTDPHDPCSLILSSQTLTPSPAWMAGDCNGDKIPNGEALLFFKSSTKPVMSPDGSFMMKYTITIKNLRPETITNISVVDDLVRTFSSPVSFTVISTSVSGSLSRNIGYNGRTVVELLNASSTLAGNATDSIVIMVKVEPNGYSGNINNLADITATTKWGITRKQSIDLSRSAGVQVGPGIPTNDLLPVVNVKIPDIITPNNDGFNDKWIIQKPSHVRIKIILFNRLGQVVYSNDEYKNDFNGIGKGNFLGKELTNGTYFYLIDLLDTQTNVKEVRRGYLTLKREF
ncbi:MAG: tandem-95 repeat protein [Chitinophagaceae bacterium]